MKKLLILSVLIMLSISGAFAAVSYQQAMSEIGEKPAIVFVGAAWADNIQHYLTSFKSAQKSWENVCNFVELDFADNQKFSDSAAFNKRYEIYPNLPYVIMLRSGGNVSRFVMKDCIENTECFQSKVKAFLK